MFCATLVIVTKTVIRAAILRLSIGSEMLPVAHLPDNETTERRERMWSGIIKLNAVAHSSPFSRVWLYVVAAVCSSLWRSRVVVSYWSDGSFIRMGHGTSDLLLLHANGE